MINSQKWKLFLILFFHFTNCCPLGHFIHFVLSFLNFHVRRSDTPHIRRSHTSPTLYSHSPTSPSLHPMLCSRIACFYITLRRPSSSNHLQFFRATSISPDFNRSPSTLSSEPSPCNISTSLKPSSPFLPYILCNEYHSIGHTLLHRALWYILAVFLSFWKSLPIQTAFRKPFSLHGSQY